MKLNDRILLYNLIESARMTYVKCYNLAINSDFCKNKESINRLDNKLFNIYYKYQKRPKKVFRSLLYAASLLYNNEIIVDFTLCCELNILLAIAKRNLYKTHKFIQFLDNHNYIEYLIPGIKRDQIDTMLNNLLRGIKC